MKPEVYEYFLQKVLTDETYTNASWRQDKIKDILLEEYMELYDNNTKFKNKINKIVFPQTKNKSYIYLTLSPDKYLRNLEATDSNISNLHTWCKKWFDQDVRYYNRFAWVIESGSQGNHLHVHAVCDMKTSHKHAQRLKSFWKKYFPNNQLLLSGKKTGNEYHSMRFDTEEIWQDKLEYFTNEKKGTHENLVDLGLRGSRGISY